jgi:hypothetical protein
MAWKKSLATLYDELNAGSKDLSSTYQRPYKEQLTPADRWGSVKATPIEVYRTDPKTKKPESQAHKYDLGFSGNTDDSNTRQPIDPAMFHALHDAMKLNPNLKVTPDEMVALLAQEGRTDFGANDLHPNNYAHNKQATELHQQLLKMGYDPMAAGFPALLLEKQTVAKRLDVPWQQAWNGMGTVRGTSRTGADYAKEIGMNAQNIAVNKDAVKAVKQLMQEPKKADTLEAANSRDWARRQQAVQKAREDYVARAKAIEKPDSAVAAGLTTNMTIGELKRLYDPELAAQEMYPDAPIPLPGAPNLAVKRKAKGGPIELPKNYRNGGRTRMI